MPTIAALVSGLGWHVQDLQRAATAMRVEFRPVPFPAIVATVGMGSLDEPSPQPFPAGSGGNSTSVAPLERVPEGRAGVRVESLNPRLIAVSAEGVDFTKVDGVLLRMMPPGSLEQVIFRMDALHRLHARGIPLLNPPRAIEAAVDKYLALALLEAEGIPVPPTWVGESADDALTAFGRLGGDVVVKPLFGSEGRGLVRVSDHELARRTFQTLSRIGAVLYVQKFINHPGYDVRAFVIGDQVIGAIRRTATGGDWRTNVAVGGVATPFALDAETERMAVRAARAVGATAAGVDLLPNPESNQLVVLEVNAVPGWRSLAKATGVDVARLLLLELLGDRS